MNIEYPILEYFWKPSFSQYVGALEADLLAITPLLRDTNHKQWKKLLTLSDELKENV